MDWHAKTKEEIFSELNSSKSGLSDEEAKQRLQKYGKNEIKKTHRLEPLKIFFSQFKSFLIYILIVAAAISFFIKHYIDGIVISAIVFLNAGIGFFQQYKAEKAIINLKKFVVPESKVVRDGKLKSVSSHELVPGDIVKLKSGDKVNADCRILNYENLQINEAVLTGESLPVDKNDKPLAEDTILAERKNMLFTGTQIVRGSVEAIVVETGMKTEFGKIAGTLQKIKIRKTPMQKRLDKFSRQVGILILIFVAGVMLLGLFEKFDLVEMFLTSVALAVSAIPEGLPAVLTISFAIGSIFMSKKNVIIRKLPAIESLGSVTVICSDKTGTITEEKMQVQELFADNEFYLKKENKIFSKKSKKEIQVKKDRELIQLIKTGVLCNNAHFEVSEKSDKKYEIFGDPTEEALLRIGLKFDINKKDLTEQEPRIEEISFTSKRKMMSIIRNDGRKKIMYAKGSSEKILEACSFELKDNQAKRLTDKRKKELIEKSKEMEADALRVLGFAFKNIPKKTKKFQEKGLIFTGFMGMLDPPRKEVKDAVLQCKNAGIEVKIITGDSELTATAIAKQIGITGKTLTEHDLVKMSDEELMSSIDEITVFARTTPKQKLRITKILQEKRETVAITGDGINDVLALKSADIGIAMGIRGTDVARDVSDVVLIDDNFASIVEGVRQGRKTYDNIKKFTKYLLAVNFSAIFLIIFALLLGMPLPLLPLQILWMNLITDSFPALTLVFEKGENLMNSKPRKEKSILDRIWKFIIVAGILAFIVELSIFLISMNNNWGIELTRTMVLTTAILYELFFIYTCRSEKPLIETGIFSNKWLNYAIIFSLVLQFILLYTPLAGFFGVVPLSFNNWLFIIPFAVSGLIIFEIGKYFRKKF